MDLLEAQKAANSYLHRIASHAWASEQEEKREREDLSALVTEIMNYEQLTSMFRSHAKWKRNHPQDFSLPQDLERLFVKLRACLDVNGVGCLEQEATRLAVSAGLRVVDQALKYGESAYAKRVLELLSAAPGTQKVPVIAALLEKYRNEELNNKSYRETVAVYGNHYGLTMD